MTMMLCEIEGSEQLADVVRHACIRAALEGYERAALCGLCREGAWEAAISAMKMLDLELVLREPVTD